METIEGNKLIAEFMGAECETDDFDRVTNEYDLFGAGLLPDISGFDPDAKHFYTPDQMKFHESWDWLMPVVEKIEDIQDGNEGDSIRGHIYEVTIKQGNIVTIQGDGCSIWADASPKILSVWIAVVEFIKWYNQNK